MQKVTLTADVLLGVIKSVFNDKDIDTINDPELPEDWQGKSIQDILNIKYYTFKHRPESSEQIIREMKAAGNTQIDELMAVNRSFGCFTLDSVDREFSKNTDTAVCSGVLDFWVQTSKLKLVDSLLEKCNIALASALIPVSFKMSDGTIENRTLSIGFGRPSNFDFNTSSEIGESVQFPVEVDIGISLPTTQMIDYKFEFTIETNSNNEPVNFEELSIAKFSLAETSTTKGFPSLSKPGETGVINLSVGKTYSFVFDGVADNNFIDWLAARTLFGSDSDKNKPVFLKVTRGQASGICSTVITQHTIDVLNDGTNEVHSLNLCIRGIE